MNFHVILTVIVSLATVIYFLSIGNPEAAWTAILALLGALSPGVKIQPK